MTKSLQQFIEFKLAQRTRITEFDYSQKNIKVKLKEIVAENMEAWVREFIATGQ